MIGQLKIILTQDDFQITHIGLEVYTQILKSDNALGVGVGFQGTFHNPIYTLPHCYNFLQQHIRYFKNQEKNILPF